MAGREGGADDHAFRGRLADDREELRIHPPDAGEFGGSAKLYTDFAAVIHADGVEGFVRSADIDEIAAAEARG